MCEPTTIALAAAAGSSALKAYGAYESGQAEAELNRVNADLFRAKAADARARGATQAGLIRMKGSAAIGEAKTQLAKSGIELTSPAALSLFDTSGTMSELDAQVAKANAAREAWGYDVAAAEADARRRAAKKRSILGTVGAVLGGASSAFGIAKGMGGGGGGNPFDTGSGADYSPGGSHEGYT